MQTMELREESEKVMEENLLKRAGETAAGRVLGVRNLETKVKKTASKISVSYSGNQSILKVPFDITAVYERTYPELTLRLLSGKRGE